ncbi:uncharacterized protein C3orf67 homolog isoform X3 [Oryzias melastigma]|uniref:uncharacterized protein C3orf67 homolog isoform X3 n=1 Tax=Oryzias melastigma TaxID=30732 RepID=UPI000CF7D6CE|nr:uncharacterized protein C3orf67 homolog isoform X3 [Oryzias melastigma]
MFKNNYQGGAVFELFSGHGKDPVGKWKLYGGPLAIYKEYNKEVKGFVYCLEGSSQTVKMQIPENGKMSLGLIQRFLVLQVNIPLDHDFSTELVITDSDHQKRRLHLSTVHKQLSATIWHARIPFIGLKRNTWSTLCIDLVSMASELFKGFLTLDGITLFATCKVRRIFTMKEEPSAMSRDGTFLSVASLMDIIPHNFLYPASVNQTTQVLNSDILHMGVKKSGPCNSDCVLDQSPTARSTGYQRTRPQGATRTASGFRASALSPQAVFLIIPQQSTSSGMNHKVASQSQSGTNLSEKLPHGASCKLQSHTQKKGVFSKTGCKRLQVPSARRETLPSSAETPPGEESGAQRKTKSRIIKDERVIQSRQQISGQESSTSTGNSLLPASDACSNSRDNESSGVTTKPAECELFSILPDSSSDPQLWNNSESYEGYEPQLTLQEEDFIFSSQPRSSKWGQGQVDQEKMNTADDLLQTERQFHTHLEDDFIGSESDEEENSTFQDEGNGVSFSVTPRSPSKAHQMPLEGYHECPPMNQTSSPQLNLPNTLLPSERCGRAEPAGMVPIRCLSPNRLDCSLEERTQVVDENSYVSLCSTLLREVKLDDSIQHEEVGDAKTTVDSTPNPSQLSVCLKIHEDEDNDEEELQMLAILKSEQEKDDSKHLGLSASQIRQCNVSVSLSSDSASTRTSICTPMNQGHHYQREMNPLLQSNPREWMDVLSPPIMPPSPQRRSGNTWNNLKSLVREEVKEEKDEEEYLNLLYDPCLNCYFDPETGKYYELA